MPRKSEFARKRALAHAIATAPGLGAFATALGALGLDGAVELCETRDPPPRVQRLWDVLGYSMAALPSREDIDLVILGAEIARRREVKRSNGEPTPIASLIDGLCDSPHEAKRALDVLANYGGRVVPIREEVTPL